MSWCRVSTTPTSRWPRLPTEQLHRRGHQRGVVRRGRTVGQPQRVLHADAGLHAARPACSSSGQQLSSRPCSSTGAGEPAASTWPSRSSAVAMSPSARVRSSPACSARRSPTAAHDAAASAWKMPTSTPSPMLKQQLGPARSEPGSCQFTDAKSGSTVQPRRRAAARPRSGSAQKPVVTPSGRPGTACRTASTAASTMLGQQRVDAVGGLGMHVHRLGACAGARPGPRRPAARASPAGSGAGPGCGRR